MNARAFDEDALLATLEGGVGTDDGECVTVLAHSLQCAQLLAEQVPDDLELQIAGLVHDLGTLLSPGTPSRHAAIGALAVRPLLGERVAALVARHDDAKRFLVTTDPAYRARLSHRSIATLEEQGGCLTEEETRHFAADPNFESWITLRRADDDAKVADASVPELESWRALVADVARRARAHGIAGDA